MKKILSLVMIAAMLLTSIMAIVPASAAETEKVNFLPEGVYDLIKAAYEADGASTNDYVPSVTPFAYTNYKINEKIAESKLLSISIPVRKTLAADAEGNFTFTLSTFKDSGILGSEPTSTYVIKIKGADYGLEANKSNIFKFIKVDLSSYNINIAKGEVLAFAGANDTLLPAWAPNDNSNVQKIIKEKYPDLVGFAANVGKSNYSANANSCIFFDFELEKAVGWDQPEPPADASELDFTYYDTIRYMPEDVFADLKALFEKDGANTLDWVPSVAPFTPSNVAFQNLMVGTRMRSITLPVRKTLGTDADGNFTFTISTYKRDKLTNSSAVKSYAIKINAEEYGLTANTAAIYKFIKIDVSEYEIIVGEDEVLAFSANGDTLIPGYSGNVVSFLQSRFPIMMGFGAYTGKAQFTSNTWPNACIFFDMEYDVPVTKEYAQLRDLIAEADSFAKDDYSAGWENLTVTLNAAKTVFAEKPDSPDDLAAIYEVLVDAVEGLVPLASVDFTALTNAINAAKALEGKDDEYTPATWDAFAKALADAKAVAADADSKQSAVSAAATALTTAQAALAKKPALDTLAAMITKCEALTAATYTTSSWTALADALAAAKTIKDNVNATAADVDAALAALTAAYGALDTKADSTELQAKIDATFSAYDREIYTANSYKVLNDIIRDAEADIAAGEIGEKSTAEYIAKIDEAIAGLQKRADTDALKALVADWENVTDDDYHPDGIAALTEAVEDILEACKPAKAGNTSEADAEALKAALEAAIAALKKYADYTAIDAKLTETENLVKTEYTEQSWQKLVDAKSAINTLKSNKLATEDDAAKALADLNAAIDGLVKADAEQATEEPEATENEVTDILVDKSGCGSFVGASAMVVTIVSILRCAVVLKKKD